MRDTWEPLEKEATRGNRVTQVHKCKPGHHPLCTLHTAAKRELGLLSQKGCCNPPYAKTTGIW